MIPMYYYNVSLYIIDCHLHLKRWVYTSFFRKLGSPCRRPSLQVKAGLQLVTGGLGGLGLVAAEELVALGAPGGKNGRKWDKKARSFGKGLTQEE